MPKGIYSDLNDWIEEGGREEQLPDDDVRNEGNIPSGRPDESARPSKKGNIPTSDPKPRNVSQEGQISPKSKNAPKKSEQKGNIEPDDSKRPEDVKNGGIPISDKAPSPPQKRGNIQPKPFDARRGEFEEEIEPDEESQPSSPQRKGNVEPRENARPRRADSDSREARENARPTRPDSDSLEARDDASPQSPQNQNVIRLREEAAPQNVQNSGNIESQESNRPSDVRQRGNIQPTEEPSSSEPTESASFNVSSTDQDLSESGIQPQEQNQPPSPDRDESIDATENSEPPYPDRDGFIDPTEESEPQSPRRTGNIDPLSEESTDGIGGETPRQQDFQSSRFDNQIDPDSEEFTDPAPEARPPIQYQPRRFAEQINPESVEFTDGVAGSFADPSVPQWRVRKKYQPFRGQIDPKSSGFTDTSEGSFPGSTDGLSEWQVPFDYQPSRFSNQIDPNSAEFTDGTGGLYPGSQDATPESESENEHQIRLRDQINPRDQEYTDFGGTFPGSENAASAGEEDNQFQTRFSNQVNPNDPNTTDGVGGEFEGSSDAVSESQTENEFQTRKLDPRDPQFTDSVAGEFDGSQDSVSSWEAPLSFQPSRFEDQINPENIEFRIEDRTPIDPTDADSTDGVGGNFEGSNDATPEASKENQNQVRNDGIEAKNVENSDVQNVGRIDPQDASNTDGVGGDFPSSDETSEWLEPRENQTRFSGTLGEANEPIRLAEFENFGSTGSSQPGSPVPRSGFLSLPDFGTEQPYVLRKPESGGGSSVIANAKQADSRTAPIASAAEDTVRMSKFFASGKGITYNIKQQFLQSQNPRSRTRIYDPTAPIQASASGLPTRPGQDITRHLDAGSGPSGIIGDAASAIGDEIGFDIPTSSRYTDQLEDEATQTEYGEMTGSLFWLNPVTTANLPNQTGKNLKRTIERRRSEQVQNITEVFSTSKLEKLRKFTAGNLAQRGGVGDGYLYTKTYDPQGGPNSEGREETDTYHPALPYVENIDSVNSRSLPNANSYVEPQFFPEYIELANKNAEERNEQEAFFPYANPSRIPDTEDVVDGDGNVTSQRQNDTTDEVYFENRVFEDSIPLHRGVPEQEESRGLPNYSKENEDDKKTKRIDWINRLEPIIGSNVDPDQETFGNGRHSDLIPFKFYDIENSALIVFRAFLESLSDNLSPEWDQKNYSGRPEQAHVYSGYTNTLSFSFQVAPFSEEEFEAIWKKINYMKGLTTPANYSPASGGGSYMVPPQMRLTIGDMFNHVHGYMNSLTINVNEDMPWEIDENVGRLPQAVEIDIDWQVIENRGRPPKAGQKFYDAPFIDEIEEATKASPDPQPEVQPSSQDELLEEEPTGNSRAFEKSVETP